MDTSESSQSRTKRNPESSIDARDGRDEENDIWEGDDKRRHRSSKSRRHSNAEEAEEHDSGRRKSSGDRNDGRKRPSSPSRVGSRDENNYDVRRESSSKTSRKNSEERGENRSSDGYRDRDVDDSHKSRDEESEKNSLRRTSTRPSGHESSQCKSRSKVETPHEDSRYPERKEGSREKGQVQREQESYSEHRRWDDSDNDKKAPESGYVDKHDSRSIKASDHDKHGHTRDRTLESRYESGEAKGRAVGSSSEKDVRSTSREERRVDEERSKGRSRSEAWDEDNRPVTAPAEARSDADRDDNQRKARERSAGLVEDVERNDHRYNTKPHGEKGEKHRQQPDSVHGGRDEVRSRERSVNMDEDGHARMRERSGKEVGRNRRSRSPERSGRHHRELDDCDRGFSESDSGFKGKEREESYRDDRSSKGKDSNWIDKNREHEGPKDHWKKIQTRKDDKDGETAFDHVKEWDSVRREQERVDSEKFHGRPGYRKDIRIRPEVGKASSNFGNQNANSDRIEIIPNKSLDFGRQESFSTFSGRRAEVGSQQDFASGMNDEEWGHPPEEKDKGGCGYGDDLQERYNNDDSTLDQNSRRNSLDSQRITRQKGPTDFNRSGTGQSPSGGSQPSFGNNQGSGFFNRALQQGPKGARPGRGGRGGRLTGREAQRVGVPLPMMGSPFGHLGLPPGPLQPITPNMSHSPVPPIGPGVLIPPFPGSLVWTGARGVDMNMLAVQPSLPPFPPPGPAGTRFAPNMGTGPNHGMYFNQPGPGRGAPSNITNPGFNATGMNGRGAPHDKAPIGWGPPKNGGPSGKAPSRGEQNDYSQNFVDTGMRPQNFIRELELTSVVEDYPKLRELIQKKDEIVAKSASPPMYYKCDLREHVLSPEFFGTKFDVILVDPPWEEYVHRAPGVTDHMEYWTFEEIQNLKIEAIADTPSFIFLWVGDGVGLEQGRQCLKKWGFRRCEDICWVETNKTNATPGLRHDSHTLFQHSKEHCLMGIKGTVRRSIDGHIIHANIDTDVIIAEGPAYGSTKKPEDMYRIIEHFSLGKRRLELFGEDHNIRSGWLTVGKGLSSSNFNAEAYIRNFADKDGKVWQGGGGRNPPPDAPHLVVTTPDIEGLRPKSPPPKNQQQQQPIPAGSSNNRRPTGNSPQNPMVADLNQDASGSDPPTPFPWAASPMRGLRGPEVAHGDPDDKFFDGYGFNAYFAQTSGDHVESESHQAYAAL